MPNRIIREAILSSEAVCSLDWASEVFYRRLMSIVDDYGRYEANEKLLRSKCYPLQTDDVRVADISRWLAACQMAGMILVYRVDGKQYLEITKFGQQQRTASKYPSPDDACEPLIAIASKEKQVLSNAHLVVSVSEGVSVTSSPVATGSGERFEAFWKTYPKKVGKDDAKKAFDKRKPTAELLETMISAIGEQVNSDAWKKDGGQYIPNPSTWLNAGRWKDEISGSNKQASGILAGAI